MKSKRTLAVVAALAVVALLFVAAGYAYTATTSTTNNTITTSYLTVTPVKSSDAQDAEIYNKSIKDLGLQLDTVNTSGTITYTISTTNPTFYCKGGALVAEGTADATTIYKVGYQTITIDKTNITGNAVPTKIYFKVSSTTEPTDGFAIYYSISSTVATEGDKANVIGTQLVEAPISFTDNTATMIVTFFAAIDGTPTGSSEMKLIENATFEYKASTASID